MAQLRGGLGLDLEPLPLLGVDGRREREHLQGDAAAQRDLLGLINDSHSSSADFADDAEVTQLARRGIGRLDLGRWMLADHRVARPPPE